MKDTSRETTLCLAAAHALVKLDDGAIVGDPMEKTTLEALEWTFGKGIYALRYLKELCVDNILKATSSLPPIALLLTLPI